MYSPTVESAVYVIRLNLPGGDAEELSGLDSHDLDAAKVACQGVARWLFAGVFRLRDFPKGARRGVMDLRRALRKRGYRLRDVGPEVIVRKRGGVTEPVWPCDDATTVLEADIPLYTVGEYKPDDYDLI